MKNKTSYWALGVLAAITILSAVYISRTQDTYASIEYMILMMTWSGLEVVVLLLLGLVARLRSLSDITRNAELKERSKRFFLAALLVVTIGFSVCLGGGTLFDL